MSLDATNWAWNVQNIRPIQKLVLLAFADRAGDDNKAFPSLKRLTLDTCADRKSIMKAIDDLELAGLIKFTGETRGNGVKVYELIGVKNRENIDGTSTKNNTSTKNGTSTKNNTSTKNGTSTKNNTSTKNGTSTKNDTGSSTKSGTSTSTKNGTQNLSMNLSIESNNIIGKKTKKFTAENVDLPSNVNRETWIGFCEMRKLIKKPMTERAVNLILQKLEKFGEQANDVLNQSIMNNYQDIYPLKTGYTAHETRQTNSVTEYARKLQQQRDEYFAQRAEQRTHQSDFIDVF